MKHANAPRLDPRAPLVLDTRELGRRAGSMLRLRRALSAPAGLSLELVGVPAGADLGLDLRLEAVMEGVLVTGSVTAPVTGECGRCLDPVRSTLEVDVQELFVYPDVADEPGAEADEDLPRLAGDLLDLEPVVRDAVVLALPMTPLCRPDCPGLCPQCGARMAEVEPGHGHAATDPRWSGLAPLLPSLPDDEASLGGTPRSASQSMGARPEPDEYQES